MGEFARVQRDVVVIGGSAGALHPLKQIVEDLPATFPAAVIVVLHLSATGNSALAPILNRVGGLPAVRPRDGDPMRPGYIYVPTPDHHLEVTKDGLRLTRRPRVNGVRPAIDVLFRTASEVYGSRVVGVVLSGGLDDGSAGLAAIRASGGIGIVQSPAEALVDSMPKNAIALSSPEHVSPAARIGSLLLQAIHESRDTDRALLKSGGLQMEAVGANDMAGQLTGLTCPDCHGSIWMQTGNGGEVALTCRIGHAYSPESFFKTQGENVENALWAGVRSLEEQASFAKVLAARAAKFDDGAATERFETRRKLATENADRLRQLLLERSDA